MSQDPNSWAQHLAAIDAEGITTKVYADREGLSARQIYDRRKSKVEKLRKQISTPKPVQSDKYAAGSWHSAGRRTVQAARVADGLLNGRSGLLLGLGLSEV